MLLLCYYDLKINRTRVWVGDLLHEPTVFLRRRNMPRPPTQTRPPTLAQSLSALVGWSVTGGLFSGWLAFEAVWPRQLRLDR